MFTSDKQNKRKLLGGRFVSIMVAGVLLFVVFMILFNLLTSDTSVILHISATDGWWNDLQFGQTAFWSNLIPTTNPFFIHLQNNSLAYMCGLFLVLIFSLAFVLSYKKSDDDGKKKKLKY